MTTGYEAFADAPSASTAADLLFRVGEMAREQRRAEQEVTDAETALEKAKAALKTVAEIQLPALMEEAGMLEFTTSDGLVVKVDEKIRASIPAARAGEAFAWLRVHNHDGMIKHAFNVDFDKNSQEAAATFQKKLEEEGLRFEEKRSVHPSTLASWAKDQLGKGVAIPQDLFGVFRQKVAKIDQKKTK